MSQFGFRNLVVPIDFTEDSDAALSRAMAALTEGDELHVVHVLADLPITEPGMMWETQDDESRAAKVRDAFRVRYPECAACAFDVLTGDPGSRIAEFAQQIGADLIVMPSHGRKGLNRLLLGSVAERTVRLAHCAVLVLRH
jgi:nucleotide-binding universal stress UspA family protein